MEDFRCRRTRIRARRPALARARSGFGRAMRVRGLASAGCSGYGLLGAARPSECGEPRGRSATAATAWPLNECDRPHGRSTNPASRTAINESGRPRGPSTSPTSRTPQQRIQPAARPIGGGRSAAPPRTTKPGTVGPCRACARSLRQFMFTHKPVLASIFTTPSVKLLPESAPAGAPPGALSTPSTCFHCPSPWCSSACVLPSGPTTTT